MAYFIKTIKTNFAFILDFDKKYSTDELIEFVLSKINKKDENLYLVIDLCYKAVEVLVANNSTEIIEYDLFSYKSLEDKTYNYELL